MDRCVNYHFHPRELQGKKKYIVVDKYVLAAFSENTLILKKKQKKHEWSFRGSFPQVMLFCSSINLDNCLSSIYYESSDESFEIRDSKFSILNI